jgi:RHS repeat-associated protein
MRTKWLQAWCALSLAALCVPGASFGITRHHAISVRARSPQKVDQRQGQSATLLPDGNWLLLGGVGSDGTPLADGYIRNGQNGALAELGTHLQFARAWHAAAVLPNGQILIHGGTGSDGQVVTVVELFDPVKQTFSVIQGTGPIPRTHHTATVLTNGIMLLAGGVGADGSPVRELEEWSFQSGVTRVVSALLKHARENHTAYLLADGTVLLWGGSNPSEGALKYGEVFDPGTETTLTETNPPPNVDSTASPTMEISIPETGDDQASVNVFVAIRFSKSLAVSSINAQTIQLTSPQGQVSGTVIPTEQGMLAFLIPSQPLASGTKYQVTLDGLADANGLALPEQEISFQTAGGDNGTGTPAPVLPITIGTSSVGTDSRGVPTPPAIPPLEAPAGVTAVSGRVLQLNGIPLSGVLLQVDSQKAYSDATGRFLVNGVTSGHRVLIIDGEQAGPQGVFYGIYQVGVDTIAGQTNVLKYTIWMTEIDKAHEIAIPSPTTGETVVSSPAIPGLELHLPANTVLRDLHGNVVTQLGITSIPVKQPPFPLPIGVKVPIYFTIQPGGAYLDTGSGQWSKGAQLYYPNIHHAPPGTAFDFWNYDPTAKGWYRYGVGKVSQDGKQIVPEPGVEIYELTGAMVASPGFAPYVRPHPADPNGGGGDPVDLETGLFVYNKTDLVVSDLMPISLSRTYRQNDWQTRSFGVGASNAYDIFLVSNTTCGALAQPGCYQDAELILPDGSQVQYLRTSPGYHWYDAVFQTLTTPTEFYGSQITWNGAGWNLTMKDATIYQFPDGENATNSQQAALTAIFDRYGNKLSITRLSNGTMSYISTPNSRWMQFTSDSSGRITGATDNIGRSVGYVYDANGNLIQFTDANGGVTKYTYGTSSQMTAIQDPRGITYLANIYDANQRLIRQVQGDGSSFQFVYITDPDSGQVVETDVTDPLGHVRKVAFNVNGFTQTDTTAAGLPEQQTSTFNWDITTNLLQSLVDPLGRQISYSYDALGNTASVTFLAGTAFATTTSLTYEPIFSQITSIVDPLQHVTTFRYDNLGNLTGITDPIGDQTTYSYKPTGQLQTASDALLNTLQFGYDGGDLVSITDALNYSTQIFVDGAGRRASITNPSGFTRRWTYDANDHVLSVTDSQKGVTSFSYDGNGNMTSITDALSHVNTFSYDFMNRPAGYQDARGFAEAYSYDADGNVVQFTDRRGKIAAFSFDGQHRMIFAGYGKSGGTYDNTTSYSYDAAGRFTHIVNSESGTMSPTFDGMNQLISETTPNGIVAYTYDASGQRNSMTVSGQPTVNYSYDNASRLAGIQQGSASVSFLYDSNDRPKSITLPNGVTAAYSYDNNSQITGITYASGTLNLGNLNYTYDATGRRTNVGGSLATTGLPLPVGNATYNELNQLTQWGTANLFYDANGNMLSDGTDGYVWDSRNHLTSVFSGATYEYDSYGRRIQKSVGGISTSYLYDGKNDVQELVGGVATANLLTGLAVDDFLSRTDSSGAASYIRDATGNTVGLANSSGVLQTAYTYDAFGTTNTNGTTSSNSHEYTGRDNDGNSLYFLRGRYYNPNLGRFIAEDPIGQAGGLNQFAYVADDPLNLVDPEGLLAHVEQDGDTINVTASITIYGPSATDELAAKWQSSINDRWNNRGNNFKIGRCTVKFNVQVHADPGHKHFRDAAAADNKIYVNRDPNFRSYSIRFHPANPQTGYGIWSVADRWGAAHEAGHLFGLPDDYHDTAAGISVPNAGHEGHIMAASGAAVAWHEVRDIIHNNMCHCNR